MKKLLYYFLIIFLGTTLYSCSLLKGSNYVCYKKDCFKVEVACTQKDRHKGLQFRKSMGEDKGMLFVFDESQKHRFWMKHTVIPLDIIWIDSSERVVDIKQSVLPCYTVSCPTYEPKEEALYVLELNAGKTKEIKLTVGAQLRFELNNYPDEDDL